MNSNKKPQENHSNLLLISTNSTTKTWEIQLESKENEYVCTTKSQKLIPLQDATSDIVDVCWDDMGTRIAQVQQDRTLNIIDYSTNRVVSTLQITSGDGVASGDEMRIAFIKQSSNQISISHGGSNRVLDANSGKILYDFTSVEYAMLFSDVKKQYRRTHCPFITYIIVRRQETSHHCSVDDAT